jgi:hypothetical protein
MYTCHLLLFTWWIVRPVLGYLQLDTTPCVYVTAPSYPDFEGRYYSTTADSTHFGGCTFSVDRWVKPLCTGIGGCQGLPQSSCTGSCTWDELHSILFTVPLGRDGECNLTYEAFTLGTSLIYPDYYFASTVYQCVASVWTTTSNSDSCMSNTHVPLLSSTFHELTLSDCPLTPAPVPTPAPTSIPTLDYSILGPINSLILDPTPAPTNFPTLHQTLYPTLTPTKLPTAYPTPVPTHPPTFSPTPTPTKLPTSSPTLAPTNLPTYNPTLAPTIPTIFNGWVSIKVIQNATVVGYVSLIHKHNSTYLGIALTESTCSDLDCGFLFQSVHRIDQWKYHYICINYM